MKYFAILSIFFMLFSCNKEKRYSKKLMKGEVWIVTGVQVEDSSLSIYGTWKILSDVDIYDSVPKALWKNGTEDALFEWQFQNKGKSFQMNYMQLCEECEGPDLDNLDYVVYDLTGSYTVKKHASKKMKFVSFSTIGYPGKAVEISITKKYVYKG
ncbi:MAG: hypothetical protein PHQ74_01380 [Crocinitomicaceae bacterium]|nr:hypothetical protein [Crocinitomicaceae bacterium]